jgi:hypothetical protein
MKKTAIIAGFGLVFSGLMAQTQQVVVQPVSSVNEAKIVSSAPGSVAPDYDTKLYASREEAMLAEQGNNPAKPTTPDSDPKLEAEGIFKADVVPAPSRPTTPDIDPKLNTEVDLTIQTERAPEIIGIQPDTANDGLDANTGQEREKTEGNILNYREISGPPSQEIPAPIGNIINYREIKGPDDQPLGMPSVR